MTGGRVLELTDDSSGRWIVETASGSRHLFDLDTNTYARRPSNSGAALDNRLNEASPHALLVVDQWPRVNAQFGIWIDLDGDEIDLSSGYVTRITRLADNDDLGIELEPMPLLAQVATAPPTNAWLLVGDNASYPTTAELQAQRHPVDPDLVEWTCPRQIVRGDLVLVYFMAPRKAVHFATRAVFPPIYDPTITVNAERTIDPHQWWTDLAPLVEVPPVPFSTLQELHDGHLILKGKPTHYLTPAVISQLVAGFTNLNEEQRLILQTPVGDPSLPDPNTATVEDLRRIASGTLQVEAAVEQYIVEPLLRLCFAATDGFRVERQYRIPGAGVADFAVHGPDGLAGVVEVKLGVQYRRGGGLQGSPDLEQVIRYAHAADVPALLIDSNDIIVIDRDADEPSTSLDRSRLTEDHLAIIASHFNPSGRG